MWDGRIYTICDKCGDKIYKKGNKMKKPKDLVMIIAVLLIGVILGLQVKVVSAGRSPKLINCLTVCEDSYEKNKYNHGLNYALIELEKCRSLCFGGQ